jgi:subtilisin family serine protease
MGPLRIASLALGLAAAMLCAGSAAAQILGGGAPGLPGLGATLPDIPRVERGLAPIRPAPLHEVGRTARALKDTVDDLATAPLADLRRLTAERLLRDHADVVEPDDQGRPVVRGEVLAVGFDAATVRRLRQAGFRVRAQGSLAGLGIDSLTLSVPKGLSAAEAVRRLRELDPAGQYDFNHLYQESGSVGGLATAAAKASAAIPDGRGLRIGLVDGSVAPRAPSLARARLVQQTFAAGGPRATAHATAIASLMAGAEGPFRGAAPGATLYVADVYGSTPTGGSAEAVARGLAWLAGAKVPVINISLVGPPNILLKTAVDALVARGHLVVAAVGNDGPAAPPLYPAAWPGVVAVTGVDARRSVLPEAGRGSHVDFAAPGSDMAAAGLGGGFVGVRGTSFAAPIAAGRLALLLAVPDRAGAARSLATLGDQAIDLGAAGPDPIYGRGLVGAEVRLDPGSLLARARPR